ncbi:hypothetical protein SRABI106_02403 [Rahnella aquatilis]|nr:hypothetical protein SRABI106_02403 [Rahnella aquatilis]
MGIQQLGILLVLILIKAGKGRIVKDAILAVAALHLQRDAGHRFTATRITQRGAVDTRRLPAELIQAVIGLIGQHQQRQHHQQESH